MPPPPSQEFPQARVAAPLIFAWQGSALARYVHAVVLRERVHAELAEARCFFSPTALSPQTAVARAPPVMPLVCPFRQPSQRHRPPFIDIVLLFASVGTAYARVARASPRAPARRCTAPAIRTARPRQRKRRRCCCSEGAASRADMMRAAAGISGMPGVLGDGGGAPATNSRQKAPEQQPPRAANRAGG